MFRTLIVLPDGTELFSGVGTVNAIQSATITQCVNGAQELTLGSACANMLEAKLITPNGGLTVGAGDELRVYRVDDGGDRSQIGLFTTEKPVRPSANTYCITAYDRVSWLDRDMSQWLGALTGWPYSLYCLAQMVCAACGLELVNEEIPNGNYPVQKFSAEGITGRQLMQWIGQAAGRFCRATPDGQIEFAWYQPVETVVIGPKQLQPATISYDGEGDLSILSDRITVTDDGDGNVAVDSDILQVWDDGDGSICVEFRDGLAQMYCYQGSVSQEDYTVAPIEKVQIRHSDEDVGTVYPEDAAQANTYIITGNYLLTAATSETLLPIARSLYEQLKDVSYRPCKVSVPASMDIRAGDIVKITDRSGLSFSAYVMTKTTSGQKDTLECTGSHHRASTTAVNNQSYKALSGKVLNLTTTVEGLKIENANTMGNVATLGLNLKSITSRVESAEKAESNLEGRVSTVEQTAQGITFSVSSISTALENKADKTDVQEITEHFTFAEDGMTIRNSATGMGIGVSEQRVIFTGGDDPTTEIYPDRMETTDLKIGKQLDIGPFSWFPRNNGNLSLRYVGKG